MMQQLKSVSTKARTAQAAFIVVSELCTPDPKAASITHALGMMQLLKGIRTRARTAPVAFRGQKETAGEEKTRSRAS